MPVPTVVQHEKNIWVAAGEGDLSRVTELIETESLSPNVPDPYTYTPMHAAASYGHIHVLEYLISKGGDVNIRDGDGDTPLFTIESIDVARWLVEHGASINCINNEGNTPARHLAEDFPSISAYLHSLDPSAPALLAAPPPQPSNYTTDQTASQLARSLMTNAQAIMQRAEAEGRDPETELREFVRDFVLEGVVTGAQWARESRAEEGTNEHGRRPGDDCTEQDSKRQRLDEAGR